MGETKLIWDDVGYERKDSPSYTENIKYVDILHDIQ
jgi:hypothetical protein